MFRINPHCYIGQNRIDNVGIVKKITKNSYRSRMYCKT
jgi:hypothetical protein